MCATSTSTMEINSFMGIWQQSFSHLSEEFNTIWDRLDFHHSLVSSS